MSKIKDTIIEEQDTGVNVYGNKTPKQLEEDNKVFCEKCLDTGIIEIMGGSDADEWGVIAEKACDCGQKPYKVLLTEEKLSTKHIDNCTGCALCEL